MFRQSPRFFRFQKAAEGTATSMVWKFRKLTKGKPQTSILVHLRTGHNIHPSQPHWKGSLLTLSGMQMRPWISFPLPHPLPRTPSIESPPEIAVGSKNITMKKLLNERGRLYPLIQHINDTSRFRSTVGVIPPVKDLEFLLKKVLISTNLYIMLNCSDWWSMPTASISCQFCNRLPHALIITYFEEPDAYLFHLAKRSLSNKTYPP